MDYSEPLKRAVSIVGTQRELGEKCDVSQQNVWNWIHVLKGAPAKYCTKIEQATGGKVSRHELRPDIFGDQPIQKAS